jgi:hypothetical protein
MSPLLIGLILAKDGLETSLNHSLGSFLAKWPPVTCLIGLILAKDGLETSLSHSLGSFLAKDGLEPVLSGVLLSHFRLNGLLSPVLLRVLLGGPVNLWVNAAFRRRTTGPYYLHIY